MYNGAVFDTRTPASASPSGRRVGPNSACREKLEKTIILYTKVVSPDLPSLRDLGLALQNSLTPLMATSSISHLAPLLDAPAVHFGRRSCQSFCSAHDGEQNLVAGGEEGNGIYIWVALGNMPSGSDPWPEMRQKKNIRPSGRKRVYISAYASGSFQRTMGQKTPTVLHNLSEGVRCDR